MLILLVKKLLCHHHYHYYLKNCPRWFKVCYDPLKKNKYQVRKTLIEIILKDAVKYKDPKLHSDILAVCYANYGVRGEYLT